MFLSERLDARRCEALGLIDRSHPIASCATPPSLSFCVATRGQEVG